MSNDYVSLDSQNNDNTGSFAEQLQNAMQGGDSGTSTVPATGANDQTNYVSQDSQNPLVGANPNQGMGPPTSYDNSNWLSTPGASATSQLGNYTQSAGPNPEPGVLSSVYSALFGDKEKNGNTDSGAVGDIAQALGISKNLKDPENLSSIMKLLMGAGSLASTLHRRGTAQNALTPQQLLAMVSPNGSSFNPSQQASANNYFNTPVGNFADRSRLFASNMQSPTVAGVGTNGMVTGHFADGGMVNPGAGIDPTNMADTNPNQYPYQMAQPMPPVNNNYAEGGKVADSLFDNKDISNGKFVSDGALSLVHGNGSGQDDLVHAKLSPGEYVMDADTVASLGDGNNAHGAKVLDAWREELRKHKRSANENAIPPKANTPSSYLKTGALTSMHNSRSK